MTIIIAWAIILFPAIIVQYGFRNSPTTARIAAALFTGCLHYVVLSAMIFFFSYFWVATQFQPTQNADDLKKYGGYNSIGCPGKTTGGLFHFSKIRVAFAPPHFFFMIFAVLWFF